MSEPKFKVGDRVKYLGSEIDYDFGRDLGSAKVGDIVEISKVGGRDSHGGYLYGVKGSRYDTPEWNRMEKYFELISETKPLTLLAVYKHGPKKLLRDIRDVKEDATIYKITPYCEIKEEKVMKRKYFNKNWNKKKTKKRR